MKRARSIRLQPKLLLGLVAMAAVLAAILAPSIAQLYRARMEEQYASLAFGQASVAADLIDGDRVEQYYRTGEKDAYYEEIHRYLQDAREKLGLKYFYVVVPEDEVMYYIWDAGVPGEDGVCDLGDTDAYYGGGNELMHGAFSVDAEQTILITNNEEYGYLASAYVAILNKAGTPVALASVDISMDMIDQQIRQFLVLTLCVVLAVLLLSIFAYYYYVRRILIRPLRTLHHAAIGLVESKMAALSDFRVEVNTGDELEELAHSFQYMVSELNEYIQNLSRVTAEKERIGAELDVARHIQASMLPCIFPAFPERHEGGRRRLLRLLPGGRRPSGAGHGGRIRQGRPRGAVYDDLQNAAEIRRAERSVPEGRAGKGERSALRKQRSGDVRHRLVGHPRDLHGKNEVRQRRPRVSGHHAQRRLL